MRDINKVFLMGRLGVDPVLRSTQNGTPVANFSLATETAGKDKQEAETQWHRVVVWGKHAEWCNDQLKKGSPLFLEGKIKTKKWEDQEGQTRYMTEVHADQVSVIPVKKKSAPADIEAEALEESMAN